MFWWHTEGWSLGCLKWGGRCCCPESGFGDSPASQYLYRITVLGEGSGEYRQFLCTDGMCCDVSSTVNYLILCAL